MVLLFFAATNVEQLFCAPIPQRGDFSKMPLSHHNTTNGVAWPK